ncbi:MAG: YfiR family protein [candidate division Zixibacteria bacterium]|nr:YfiR family protein [candidate division Zixibacteria bacterium]
MTKKFVILCLLFLFAAIPAQANDDVDYKAKFIIKLLNYVDWPSGAGTNGSGAIVINVLGGSAITPKLTALAAKKTASGTAVTIKEVTIDDNIADCQILYMGTKETSDLAKVLKKVNGTTALTVSDAEYFGNYGVMINFFAEEKGGKKKTKFEINKTVADMAGLKISSKLLKLAKII